MLCQIEDDDKMPTDSAGHVAELVMDPKSRAARMNLGGLYEMYFGAASRDAAEVIREKLLTRFSTAHADVMRSMVRMTKMTVYQATKKLMELPQQEIDEAYRFLLGFYQIVSPWQYEEMVTLEGADRIEALANIIQDDIRIFYPTNNPIEMDQAVKRLEERYRPVYGPVTYVGNSGNRVVTHANVRVAPLYIMLLEKIADDGSSVSYGKLQHFGVLSPINRSEKYAYPFRNSPVRTIGETEGRLFNAFCGRRTIAEMIDRSNSTVTNKFVVNTLLESDTPTNIDAVVDRNIVQFGNVKPLQLINHLAICSGWISRYQRS